jgi:hypothetical protein
MSALWFTTPSSSRRWNSRARLIADVRAGGRFPEDGLSVAIRGCGSESRLISTKFSHSS